MANDLFSSLRTYLNKVSEGERTPADIANALNTWVKQSGDVLKSKIDEEVHNTVARMGFIKREEFEELKSEFEKFRNASNSSQSKERAGTTKKSSVSKKSAPVKSAKGKSSSASTGRKKK